jgi:hypothetical protein
MSRLRYAVTVGVVTVLLAGCSGVPTSSRPEVVRTVTGGVAPSAAVAVTPTAGADPRQIVAVFLTVNASEDSHHTAARGFLTADAAKKWTDTTTSVVSDYQVGVADPVTHAVTVTADRLGTIDAHGIYTPVTQGGGTTPVTLSFGMQQVDQQWRISALLSGLIVQRAEFVQTYKPRPVYFFDQTQKRLVPDLRYSALSDQSLCTWLLEQLTTGPRAELQSAYTSDLPEQTAHAAVSFEPNAIVIDLPGASQLDAQTKGRLAVQLAFTFRLEFGAAPVSITDSSKPVAIPSVTTPFSSDSFPTYSTAPGPPAVYYVAAGAVVDDNGASVGGPAGETSAGLDSIAVAQRNGSLLLAATKKVDGGQQLVIGSLTGALTTASIAPGTMTRPAWAPGLNEVWVGSGSKLLRLPDAGKTAVPVALSSTSGTVGGQIKSVAFSVDGVRIALVIGAADGSSQLWIGSIVRTATGATVDSMEPVTPIGLRLTDVAWNDVSTLYAIGSDVARPGSYGIWSVQVDGSSLTARAITNLPGAPDSITASQYGLPWVSAKTAVWVQRGPENAWTAPTGRGPGQTTYGTGPNYVQ